jgi:TldD protein
LYFEDRRSSRLIYENQRLDQVIEGQDRGCGLRVVFDHRMVHGFTTDLSMDGLLALATRLSASVGLDAQASKEVPIWAAPSKWVEPAGVAKEMSTYHILKDPRLVPIEEKVALMERADRTARSQLPETQQVTAMLLGSHKRFVVVNSDGVIAPDEKTYTHFVVSVVGSRDGRVEQSTESNGGYVGFEFFDENSPEAMATEAARRVGVQLRAVAAPSGSLPVVLSSEAGGTMIHEAVGHGLEADLACEGLSVYQGKLGQQVASHLITVVDDGGMPGRRGSYLFDDEGTPSQKNILIEKGILKGYMVDRICAMKFDLPPTGNGRRETFRHRPMVRMTNTYVAPGVDDPAAILRDTPRGIFVRSMGGGQVNTVTGDFVFAVDEAYLIRDGKLAEPIRGATLVGNGPAVMRSVDRVGNDLGFATGTCGKDGQGAPVTDAQPTMRIPEMTVGGEVPLSTYFA